MIEKGECVTFMWTENVERTAWIITGVVSKVLENGFYLEGRINLFRFCDMILLESHLTNAGL